MCKVIGYINATFVLSLLNVLKLVENVGEV